MFFKVFSLLFVFLPSLAFAQSLAWGTSGSTTENLADPHSWSWNSEWRIGQQLFEPLVLKGSGGDYIPVLAQDLEFSGPGELKISLRGGVQFHSGDNFEAEDVVFSFERAWKDNSSVNHLASTFKSVIAESDDQVRVAYSGTKDQAIFALSKIMMVDKQWNDNNGFSDSGPGYGQVNGTGAFMLADYQPGVRIELVNFGNYREQLEHPYDQVEIIVINDQSAALNAVLTGELDFVDNLPFEVARRASGQPNLQVRQFSTDIYFTAEADAKLGSSPANTDSIYLPYLQKTLSQVLTKTDPGSAGYSMLNDVTASNDWHEIKNLAPSDGLPDSITISCQYESGFLGDICHSLDTELVSNGINSKLNYDRSRWNDAQLFVQWRRLNDLRLPDASYSSEDEKRMSLPILADYKSVVAKTELAIGFGLAGTPLLSPYAAASDDDDDCDDCPPSGACSQKTVLSRQECCPPSGACAQYR